GATLWHLVWLGVLGNTLYQLGFVLGLARSTATNTSLIVSAAPAVVAILGAAMGLERTTPRTRLGIAFGIAGVLVVVLAGPAAAELEARIGDLFTLGALLCWSVYTVGLRRVSGMSALRVTAWTAYTGTPGLVLAGLPDLVHVQWRAVDLAVWGALAYATALSLVLAYLIWNASVRAVGATRTAIYMCFTPLVAVLVAWGALGERPGLLHVAGGVLIVLGVVLTRL
ncbi:MAG: DMT family transporter, partial [Deltaproteobacteria bacterium]